MRGFRWDMRHRFLNLFGFVTFLVIGAGCCPAQDEVGRVPQQLDWSSWKERCLALPSNQSILSQQAPAGRAAISSEQFDDLLERFFALQLQQALANAAQWVGGKPDGAFFDPQLSYFRDSGVPFMPFAQKLNLNPETRVIFNGDLHGDIRSLITTIGSWQEKGLLDGFRIVAPDTHLVFLGDYTDRGFYGVEVISTLLRLKLENPGNIWMSRGNHEEFQLVTQYGFVAEMQKKFGVLYDVNKVVGIYDCLPVVIYVGSSSGDYLQCNHGGMEPGFDPRSLLESGEPLAYQLIGQLNQRTFADAHPELLDAVGFPERNQLQALLADFTPETPTTPRTFGFLWNDFSAFAEDPALAFKDQRGWVYGQAGTAAVLKANSTQNVRVQAVFRAHQHSRSLSPLMQRLLVSRGVFRHWQTTDAVGLATAPPTLLERLLDTSTIRSVKEGAVYTFNVSPDSVYGVGCYYNFATHGILSITEAFSDWKLEVVALPVNFE